MSERRDAAAAADGVVHRDLQVAVAVTRGAFSLSAEFEVSAAETTVLVGPSGAGKTTCLHLIAGLLRPDRGRITLRGRELCNTERRLHLPPEQRRVGLLFQHHALFPHLTVRQNIAFGPRMARLPRREADSAVAGWLERLEIQEFADQAVGELSGGQRQRVALARALAAQPDCLLLDEPFSALDVGTRLTVRAKLRQFLATVAVPTVIVTHDPLDALLLGDQIVVLESGKVSQSGPRGELIRQPRTPFVAELTGLNLYAAMLTPGTGLKIARAGELEFHVLADDLDGPVYLAFAPSEVTLFPESRDTSARNVFRGVVSDVLPLTDRLRVTLDVGAPLTAEVTREAVASLHIAPGQPLWAAVKATAIHVYR